MTSVYVFVIGVLCLWGSCVRGDIKKCVFKNSDGRLSTFFNTVNGIATFPCSYMVADFRCGKVRTVVTADNSVGDDGKTYINSVTVETDTNIGGVSVCQNNTVNVALIEEFKNKGDFEARLWRWNFDGDAKPDEENRIQGFYDRGRRSAYVSYGPLRVDFEINEDRLTIACEETEFKNAVGFPRTLCGSDSNTEDDVSSIELAHNETISDMSRVRYDFVQLVKLDIVQTKDICVEASNLVSGRCARKGDQMYKCHHLYSLLGKGNYGLCIRRNQINALKAYNVCLKVLCGQDVTLDDNECGILKRVRNNCGDRDSAPVTASELLSMTQCDAPSGQRASNLTTTRAPKPKTTRTPKTTTTEQWIWRK